MHQHVSSYLSLVKLQVFLLLPSFCLSVFYIKKKKVVRSCPIFHSTTHPRQPLHSINNLIREGLWRNPSFFCTAAGIIFFFSSLKGLTFSSLILRVYLNQIFMIYLQYCDSDTSGLPLLFQKNRLDFFFFLVFYHFRDTPAAFGGS